LKKRCLRRSTAISLIQFKIPAPAFEATLLLQRLSSKKHSLLSKSKFKFPAPAFDTTLSSKKHSVLSKSKFRRQRFLEEAFSLIKIRSLHQSVNHFQYQINQPRQSFKTTLFPRSQKFTSIRQSLPISNQSAETVVRNNAVPKKSKFLHQSVNHFQISNQSAETVV
jgi:hypothetical protein